MATETWLPLVLGYLIPVGLFLLGWGGLEAEQARRAATQGLLALALATIGYFALGFAFHLGGAAVVSTEPGLAQLDQLVGHRVEAGQYWGVVGLDGFFLTGGADTPQALTLFITYLPLVAVAVLLPTLTLSGRVQSWQVFLAGLFLATILFPVAACWGWGGGWLAALGRTLQTGHGFVDYAGSGIVYLLTGMAVLGGQIAVGREPVQTAPAGMPPAHFPLLAQLGALLMTVGWLGWSLGSPFHVASAQLNPGQIAVAGMLAMAAATATSYAYCWLALGQAEPLMVARGAVGGLVAASASVAFIPLWAALAIGALAGLLVPLGVYLVEHVLRLGNSAAAVPVAALNGAWGLLAVALFADGRWGQGWNGVGLESYRTVAGQGVTGFLPAPGFIGDGPGQLIAQLIGLGALALLGFLGGWLVTRALRLLQR